MAKWFGLWHGGANYSAPDMSHLETFDSIEEAKHALWEREATGYFSRVPFKYAGGETVEVHTPNVDKDSEIHLYAGDPRLSRDSYPDRRVYFGPRGGIKTERA